MSKLNYTKLFLVLTEKQRTMKLYSNTAQPDILELEKIAQLSVANNKDFLTPINIITNV